VWQVKQVALPRSVLKSVPWQTWQAYMLELPGPRFAEAPCCCVDEPVATHPATVPWWQADGLLMHDTREIPPRRSAPWHSVHPPALPRAMKEFVDERE